MKKITPLLLATAISFAVACSTGQTDNGTVAATVFAEKIKSTTDASIIDVRTPEEFAQGHLEGATNIDWRGNDFEKEIANLDKTKPVFVYCMSGGRSASATSKMRKMGFTNVVELEGGIMQWRANNLPETTTTNKTRVEMTKTEYDSLITSDKKVLVDFYAPWCGPCQKMKPYLDEIATEMSDSVIVIRIDVDKNPTLAKQLQIEALPTLYIYKGSAIVWKQIGYIDKAGVITAIRK
jgi:thioredoxin 1